MNGRKTSRRPAPSCTGPGSSWSTPTARSWPSPPLKRVWPQGMPPPRAERARRVEGRQARVREGLGPLGHRPRRRRPPWTDYREARDAWVDMSCATCSAGRTPTSRTGRTDAAGRRREVRSPDHAVTVRPTGALVHGDTIGALVLVIDPVDSLRDPLADGWAASPDRPDGRAAARRRTSRSASSPTAAGGRSSAPARRPCPPPASSTRRPGSRHRPRGTRSSTAAPHPAHRRQARGPADRAVRRIGRRRRGDHRGARHPGPPRRRTARPGVVRGARSTPGGAASPTRCPPTATRSTRPPSRS